MTANNFYNQYWDDIQQRGSWQMAASLKKLLEQHVHQECSIIDAGCGDGSHYSHFLAERASHYTGYELSEVAVRTANENGLHVIQQDFMQSFQHDPKTDVAVCLEVIEHLFNPEILLHSLHNSLKPGGTLLLSVPNVAVWRRRCRLLLGRFNPLGSPDTAWQAPWRDPHIRFFTAETLKQLLTQVGFDSIQIFGISDAALGRTFPSLFAWHIAAIAQKT